MSWWWEYFDARGMIPYFRAVREISDRMLAAGNGSFEPLSIEVENVDAFGVKCGKEIFVYLFNPEHSTLVIDVNIPITEHQKYKVQAMDPTMLVVKDILGIDNTSSFITLKGITLGAEKEVVYILTPSLE